jgi:hypothetical protein
MPRRLMLMFAPGGPSPTLTPERLKFSRARPPKVIRLRNLDPMTASPWPFKGSQPKCECRQQVQPGQGGNPRTHYPATRARRPINANRLAVFCTRRSAPAARPEHTNHPLAKPAARRPR